MKSSVSWDLTPCSPLKLILLWHIDQLLGNDRETNNDTTAVPRQWTVNNKGMVFSAQSSKQQLNSNRGTVFSVRSVPICYQQDKPRAGFCSVSGVERVGW
jgi:hypothetical protein